MYQRLLSLAGVMALCVPLLAQSTEFTFFRSTSPLDRTDLKFVIEEMRSVDPLAAVFLSDDGTILQVKHGSAAQEDYRSAIEASGVVLEAGTVPASALAPGLGSNVPVYLVTGNVEDDRARYMSDVESWNLAHPEAPIGAPIHTNDQ